MGKLYEQALLDAREIRATALANAKIALEEAFQPKLERMISDKIHMDLEGEESEELAPEPVATEPDGDEGEMEEPVVTEPDGDEGGSMDVPVATEPTGDEIEGGSDDFDIETEPTDVSAEEPVPGEDDELLETGAGTDVTSGAGANPEGHGGKSFKSAAPYDKKAKTVLEGEEDTLDLESIIRELEDEADEDEEDVDESKKEDEEDDDDDDVDEATKVTADADKDPEGHHGGNKNAPYTAGSKSIAEGEEDEEEVDLDEILRELEGQEVPTEFSSSPEELGGGDEELQAENDRLQNDLQTVQSDLNEHRKVVSLLKSRLSEVNLLNAKLLYTNRLFKGHTLNNSQKMKVVENFDRARNIREVKLVYATISESLSQTDLVRKSSKIVSKITEGIASKTQKSTKPVAKKSSIIDDGSAERLKKLAGII